MFVFNMNITMFLNFSLVYNQNTKSCMEFQIDKLDQIFKLWRCLEHDELLSNQLFYPKSSNLYDLGLSYISCFLTGSTWMKALCGSILQQKRQSDEKDDETKMRPRTRTF